MSVSTRRIPVCEPFLNGRELEYAQEAVQSSWISSAGKYLSAFEKQFAAYIGVSHGIATCNGTAAVHLALAALDVKPGDEVIVPNFTMMGSVLGVLYQGATPIFVDADPETWTMNPALVEAKITPRTKGIMAVHIYGHPTDMDPLLQLAKNHKIWVMEDAAEAHGATYKGRKCGALADISAFSFYANKIITTGEGGMVLTTNDQWAERSRSFRNLCFPARGPRQYLHEHVGFNYRMTNVQAAIGVGQLERIDEYVDRRRANARRYQAHLARVPHLQLPVEKPWAQNVYWMYGVVLSNKAPLTRNALMARLESAGIETRPFFMPMHRQPALINAGFTTPEAFPVTEHLAAQGFYLPSGSNLSDDDIAYVAEHLAACLR